MKSSGLTIRSFFCLFAVLFVFAHCTGRSQVHSDLPSGSGDVIEPEDQVPVYDVPAAPDIAQVEDRGGVDQPTPPPDVEIPPYCCYTDAECPDSQVCVDNLDPANQPGYCDMAPGPGECYYDHDCSDGLVCVGSGICGCYMDCDWSGPGKCVPEGGGCCTDDWQCGDGEVCVTPGPGLEEAGICAEKPGGGQCYTDKDCDGEMLCFYGQTAGCFTDSVPELGFCASVPEGCCYDDSDCDGEQVCAWAYYDDVGPGVCMPPLLMPDCYDDSDCPDDSICMGAGICPCFMDCLWAGPGICGVPIPECCMDQDDCPQNTTCVEPGPSGTCLPNAGPGLCWWDADCTDDELCVGATHCPCGDWCDEGGDFPGTCLSKEEYNCCKDDGDCEQDEVCAGSEWGAGTCQPAPEFGKCFSGMDCYMTQDCMGAVTCPCGASCYSAVEPGTCSPLPDTCCYSDDDCPEDFRCYGKIEADLMPGTCLPDPTQTPGCPPPGGCCWDNTDCVQGKSCKGASVCGCIEICFVCGDCLPDEMGICQ